MIKYQPKYYEDGIQLLTNRFACCPLDKERLARRETTNRKNFELGLVISLAMTIICLSIWKRSETKEVSPRKTQSIIDVVDEIPRTVQTHRVPAPTRPSVPIASEDESIPEDETIELTDIDFTEVPLPPPPPDEDIDDGTPIFVPYDEPPEPIGGMAAIQANLVYPEIARKAGIEGLVILHIQVDETGVVKRMRVVKSLDPHNLDEAAKDAVRNVKWKPAKQRDKPITVWISVPIRFSLQ
jgi:protein TonB